MDEIVLYPGVNEAHAFYENAHTDADNGLLIIRHHGDTRWFALTVPYAWLPWQTVRDTESLTEQIRLIAQRRGERRAVRIAVSFAWRWLDAPGTPAGRRMVLFEAEHE